MSSSQTIHLYRSLIRSAKLFSDYNFKSYALRRIKTGFSENKALTDGNIISQEYSKGLEQLASLKRQSLVSSIYPEMGNVMA